MKFRNAIVGTTSALALLLTTGVPVSAIPAPAASQASEASADEVQGITYLGEGDEGAAASEQATAYVYPEEFEGDPAEDDAHAHDEDNPSVVVEDDTVTPTESTEPSEEDTDASTTTPTITTKTETKNGVVRRPNPTPPKFTTPTPPTDEPEVKLFDLTFADKQFNNTTTKLKRTDSFQFSFSFKGYTKDMPKKQREVILQSYDSKTKTWNAVSERKVYVHYTVVNHRTTLKAEHAPHGTTFRLYAPATAEYSEVISKTVKIEREKTYVTLTNYGPERYNHMVGSKNNLRFSVYNVVPGGKDRVVVQKLVKKKWVNLKAFTGVKNGNYEIRIWTGTKWTKSQKMAYRVVYNPVGNVNHKWTTSKTKYGYLRNSKDFSSMQKEFYNYTKNICPYIVPFLDSKRGDTWWGKAPMSDGITYYKTFIPKKHRKSVAMHECGHHRQWETVLKHTSWTEFSRRADKAYSAPKGKGIEYNAECVANRWTKMTYWGYKRPDKCNTKQGSYWAWKVANKQRPW